MKADVKGPSRYLDPFNPPRLYNRWWTGLCSERNPIPFEVRVKAVVCFSIEEKHYDCCLQARRHRRAIWNL